MGDKSLAAASSDAPKNRNLQCHLPRLCADEQNRSRASPARVFIPARALRAAAL
jgi:hypothetical protein